LASKLGRGLVGVQTRLKKLNDVNSAAYERLFASSGKQKQILAALFTGNDNNIQQFDLNQKLNYSDDTPLPSSSDQYKLTPVKEVLRRIQWDSSLTPSDFSVNYYDRVADEILSAPFTKPNSSVQGREELFVIAIPEHRIASIKYKERVVWDKSARLDHVCGSGKRDEDDETATTTIQNVIDTYQEWKNINDEMKELYIIRQREVVSKVKKFLGIDRFGLLRQSSEELRQARSRRVDNDIDVAQIKSYVKNSYKLFDEARAENNMIRSTDTIPSSVDNNGSTTNHLPQSTEEFFSELVSTLPDEELREAILLEISNTDGRFTNKKEAIEEQSGAAPVVQLREDDLTEKFVKGGGAGGQKVNKTNNRVVLMHVPTQISVSVHETRSLQQNRKIARKRLLEKVDIHINGSNSKFAIKAMKEIESKIKAKARSKAKLKQRLEQRTNNHHDEDGEDVNTEEGSSEDDIDNKVLNAR
jgi:uncharacterized protein (UPF0248 family)